MSSKLQLIGVDPGIVDTALTCLSLDMEDHTIGVYSRVWSNVTRRENNTPVIDRGFLSEIATNVGDWYVKSPATFVGIEGYRQRGLNMYQDQAMLALVDRLEERLRPVEVIDNVGMKQIVPVPLLKLFHVSRFPKASNHADRVSAARVALRRGIKNDDINKLLGDYVLDNTEGREWSLVSMQTV
ncbi:RuvC-like resolvase [Microbacterium phage HitchHiker]